MGFNLLNSNSAERSDRSSVFIELILLLIVSGLISFGLFSYLSHAEALAIREANVQPTQIQQASRSGSECAKNADVYQIDDKHRQRITICNSIHFELNNNVPAFFWTSDGKRYKVLPGRPVNMGIIPNPTYVDVRAVKGTGTVTVSIN